MDLPHLSLSDRSLRMRVLLELAAVLLLVRALESQRREQNMDSPTAFVRQQERRMKTSGRSPSIGQLQAQEARTTLEHKTFLDIYSPPAEHRKTGIVCTIGPKTNNVESLQALFHEGMCVVRMNFSHGSHEYHASVIKNAREAEASIPGAIISIALDTKGPEIRTGNLAGSEDVLLESGSEVKVTTDEAFFEKVDASTIYMDYKNLPKVVQPGNNIYIDDGLISLVVKSVHDDHVIAEVKNSGMLGSKKGVNLPKIDVDLPAVSEKDMRDLRFGVEQGVNMVFASFIRSAENVHRVREVLGEDGKHIKIISKIENHEGVRNFDEILEASDGIMVARGDLGIEIDAQKVFLAQKMMIAKCNIVGKPVICATQMLESMTVNPRPTRAEVSDVANAVLDGSDCVMLSGESAKGKFPVEAVRMMASICREAESALFYRPLFDQLRTHTPTPVSMTESVASSAVNASFDITAGAIICLTLSGNSVRLIAKYRPFCPIIAVTRSGHTARVMHLYRGVFPVLAGPKDKSKEWQEDVDSRLRLGMDLGKKKGFLSGGEPVVCIQGWKGGSGHTNTMRVMVVPE